MRLESHTLMFCDATSPHTYTTSPTGAWVSATDARDLLAKYEHALLTIDLMRRAVDVETVRAIADVAVGLES